jgi:hypothetical protein
MVLPLEEAVINLKAGDGFFSSTMTFPAVMFGPLLAGLIACANVQADLDDKRYIFWRSKPANVKLLITLKFFIGLIASLIILFSPAIFTTVSTAIFCKSDIEPVLFTVPITLPILISIMMYCLCFACNVLVRKTARAWLIGMLVGCFVLVLPFMLPLNYKDYMGDVMFGTWGLYPAIILITSVAAFVFAVYAAQHDLHLRTNLKGLLWAGAGLVFILMMLLSSQVANIKVLHEKEIGYNEGLLSIEDIGGRLIFHGSHLYYGRSYIDIYENKISLTNISENLNYGKFNIPPEIEGYYARRYPRGEHLYKNIGNDLYSFEIHVYYRVEEEEASGKRKTFCEKVYLRSYNDMGENWMPVGELDISDCLANNISGVRLAMRLIDNKLIAVLNYSCVVVDVTEPEELKLIDKKLDVLKNFRPFYFRGRQEEFDIPLVPIEGISEEEKIRLSIDLNFYFYGEYSPIYKSSIVDIHDGKYAFVFIDYDEVVRYDVIHWDDEKVYCKFSASRPFTILEIITDQPGSFSPKFVKNGKLYCHEYQALMVFDIRSSGRIRKLGHFVRMDYHIEDIEVLENGNILLCLYRYQYSDEVDSNKRWYLCLLKDPE